MRTFAVALVALLALVPPPAAAQASGAFAASGWVAVRVLMADGFLLTVDFEGEFPGEHLAAGAFVSRDGVLLAAQATSVAARGPVLDYQVGAPGGLIDLRTPDARAGAAFRAPVAVGCAGPCAGRELEVVAVVAGDVRAVSWSLGGQGYALLGVASGEDAFAFRSEDFEGAQARVQSGAERLRLSAGASKTVEIERSFVGLLGNVSKLPGAQAGVDGPAGRRACPCAFGPLDGPGAYRFSVTEASRDELLLLGADAALPPR